jgi:hypothetical protein
VTLDANQLWRGQVREAAVVFGPIVEVRDVLESFLADRVLIADWQETLEAASRCFVQLGTLWSDPEMDDLGRRLESLANRGLDDEPALTQRVASDVERLLDRMRVPGVPRPEDEEWAF